MAQPGPIMKRCPQCDRTYADESLSFCVADGQVLSASYLDAAATLPLTPARATSEKTTEILPATRSPERFRGINRRNLIAGAVGLAVGAIVMVIAFSNTPESESEPIASRVVAVVMGGLIYGYMFWACFWGFPKVWRWWRKPIEKLYQLTNRIEFTSAVTVVLVFAGICALVPGIALAFVYFYALFWVGLFYSFFGGGLYQFLQARKIAKNSAA